MMLSRETGGAPRTSALDGSRALEPQLVTPNDGVCVAQRTGRSRPSGQQALEKPPGQDSPVICRLR